MTRYPSIVRVRGNLFECGGELLSATERSDLLKVAQELLPSPLGDGKVSAVSRFENGDLLIRSASPPFVGILTHEGRYFEGDELLLQREVTMEDGTIVPSPHKSILLEKKM